jgi:hypothetical protein
MTKTQLTTTSRRPTYNELLEALEGLKMSLCPRKAVPALEAAGYSADLFRAAHRNARAIIARAKQ